MEEYIKDNIFYDADYCKYCDWGYQKKTRIWTNIDRFQPKICINDCINMVGTQHRINMFIRGTTLKDRYRIPPNLIAELLSECVCKIKQLVHSLSAAFHSLSQTLQDWMLEVERS